MEAVAHHRFLRSTHIVRLLSHRAPRKIIDRLTLLYHAGLLDRPRAQLDQFNSPGSAPIVYALGNNGADVLAGLGHDFSPDIEWTDKNRDAKRPYIEHALRTADLMIPLRIAVRDDDEIQMLDARALRPSLPGPARSSSSPWTLNARVKVRGSHVAIATIPDAVFALHFKDAGKRAYFFVEADRATMPVDRSDLTQSSFRRKLLAYLAIQTERQHSERLGFANLRVLTVTAGQERIASMLASLDDITAGRGSGMFLFTDVDTLAHDDPLTLPWITSHGNMRLDFPPR
ncbi:MAG: replication-relaxation family protein [Hyphomicrobium sp.]